MQRESRRTGDGATRPRIQERRLQSLQPGRGAGVGQIDAREQRLPGPAHPNPVLQPVSAHPAFPGLAAGDHTVLIHQDDR